MINDIARKILLFLRDEDGPTAVEYALMLAFIILAALTGIVFFGQATADSLKDSRDKLP